MPNTEPTQDADYGRHDKCAEMFEAEYKMADELAEAIRSHGPWMDDQCRAVLAKYDAHRAQFDGTLT